MRSVFRPSPHFNFKLLCAVPQHSSLGGRGGSARVLNLITVLKGPAPTSFTACIRTLQKVAEVTYSPTTDSDTPKYAIFWSFIFSQFYTERNLMSDTNQ